jgi:hypothetical protein
VQRGHTATKLEEALAEAVAPEDQAKRAGVAELEPPEAQAKRGPLDKQGDPER